MSDRPGFARGEQAAAASMPRNYQAAVDLPGAATARGAHPDRRAANAGPCPGAPEPGDGGHRPAARSGLPMPLRLARPRFSRDSSAPLPTGAPRLIRRRGRRAPGGSGCRRAPSRAARAAGSGALAVRSGGASVRTLPRSGAPIRHLRDRFHCRGGEFRRGAASAADATIFSVRGASSGAAVGRTDRRGAAAVFAVPGARSSRWAILWAGSRRGCMSCATSWRGFRRPSGSKRWRRCGKWCCMSGWRLGSTTAGRL